MFTYVVGSLYQSFTHEENQGTNFKIRLQPRKNDMSACTLRAIMHGYEGHNL